MKDNTMQQFLSNIRNIVDQIHAVGARLDQEDVILYILHRFPPIYNAFQTSIRTMLHPIALEDLYFLLCSEEVNLQIENTNQAASIQTQIALSTSKRRASFQGSGSGQNTNMNHHGASSNGPRGAQIWNINPQFLLKSLHQPPKGGYLTQEQRHTSHRMSISYKQQLLTMELNKSLSAMDKQYQLNIRAQRARGKLIREVEENFRVDAFIGNATDWEKVCLGNLVGLPVVVVPTGFKSIEKAPKGGTNRRTTVTTGIYAPPDKDHIALALAMAYQSATNHHLQRPPIDDVGPNDPFKVPGAN